MGPMSDPPVQILRRCVRIWFTGPQSNRPEDVSPPVHRALHSTVSAFLAELDQLAEQTGDATLVRLSRMARQPVSTGRPKIDDAAALDEVRGLMERGTPERIALATVARRLVG